jgi:hypothetical protein
MIEVGGAPPERIRSWLTAVVGIEEKQVFGATLRLRVPRGTAALFVQRVEDAARAAGAGEVRARVVDPSLEDVFRVLLQPDSGSAVA